MAATITQVNNYISSARVALADFVDDVCRRERLGRTDMFCYRQKVILATAFMTIIVDYFEPFLLANVDDGSYEGYNFFEIDEINDCIQHLNNLCGTFYTIEL
jgi:hypothetical protein